MQKREFGADVLRIIATFFIIGVHFYLNNGFYSQPQQGAAMLVADSARWLFFSCVPLFAMLTGYLKCHAKPSLRYYKGILPTAVTWILISLICIGFKIGYLHQTKTPVEWLAEFLNYKAANYAWYIELYFSLFLLCPLLNRAFSGERKHDLLAVGTFAGLAFLPSLGNGFMVGDIQLDFVPNYILSLWPIAYYMIGAYIRLHRKSLSKWLLALLAAALCFGKGLCTFVTANGGRFNDGVGGSYSHYTVALITVVLFLLLCQFDTKRPLLRTVAAHLSARCLCIYLISSVFDNIIQPKLQPFTSPSGYWWLFWVHTLSVFALSLLASELIYPLVCFICGKKRSAGRNSFQSVHS